jgi:hypothetical protein
VQLDRTNAADAAVWDANAVANHKSSRHMKRATTAPALSSRVVLPGR